MLQFQGKNTLKYILQEFQITTVILLNMSISSNHVCDVKIIAQLKYGVKAWYGFEVKHQISHVIDLIFE